MHGVKYALALCLVLAACGDDGGSSTTDASVIPDTSSPDAAGMATALVVTVNSTRTFDLAYYGVNTDGTLYAEVYGGASPGCPSEGSPTPDYTLILGTLPATSTSTSPANLFDFVGDLHDNAPAPLTASTVSLTGLVYTPDVALTFDANLVFPGGTAAGRVHATHCDSLDD